MISWESRANCEDARGYYYDWLDEQCTDEVPQSIQVHVSHCDHCREEIERLGRVLGSSSRLNPIETSRTSMINALLEMHFKYADVPVTCVHVKRFLPSTAAQDTRITIPTPITVHIDQCTGCRNEWQELQSLNLSDAQLQRLTECIEKNDEYAVSSSQGHLTDEQVRQFAVVDYEDMDTACLEHVCKCISCRERTLAVRRAVASDVTDESQICGGVSWEELFDLALPVGFNPLADEYALFPKVTVEHAGRCQTCLRQLATLDEILLNFLLPRESGIVTHFKLDVDGAGARGRAEYDDYPIQVEVQDSPSVRLVEANRVPDAPPVRSSRRWMKVAAAVVVLMGVTIFSMMPKAGAGFLDKVYEATTREPVVQITELTDNGLRIVSEQWIFPPDKSLKVEGNTVEVLDASAGLTRTRKGAGEIDVRNLPVDLKKNLQDRVRSLFDLWPAQVSGQAPPAPVQQAGLDVYTHETSFGRAKQVWRWHVDPVTHRIQQVDKYVDDGDAAPEHWRTFMVTYPGLSETKARLSRQYGDMIPF